MQGTGATSGTDREPVAVEQALQRLLERVGLQRSDAGGRVSFLGSDPVVPSRSRYGAATAAALAAQAVGVAAVWRMRSDEGQDIRVDLRRAVTHGLRTAPLLRQNGHSFRVGAMSRSDNYFPTRDGRFIYLMRTMDYPHIVPPLLDVLRCPNELHALQAAVRKWDAHALEEALAESRAFAAIARTPEEWLAHPQGRWLAERPGVEVLRIGDSPAQPFGPAPRPLSGLKVLDASHVIAGPSTGRLLAEQGADVLRVSAPHQPDPQHIVIDTGLGKRNAFIDLNLQEDVARLRALASQADVFIESWRPGAMEKRGFGPAELAGLRPGIVYVSLSCYGCGGPWADRAGYEPIGQAASGLAVVEGGNDTPRGAPTVTMNDYLTAYLAAAGIMGALVRRAREGGSWHVRTSLTQSSMWVLAQGLLPASAAVPAQPEPVPAQWMASMDSAFGRIDHVAPVVEYSRTPSCWERPPQPLGASPAAW